MAGALLAALREDDDGLREAALRATFEGERQSKREQEARGAQLLKSLPQLVRHLGFEPLVVLLDEAETAVEKKGSPGAASS